MNMDLDDEIWRDIKGFEDYTIDTNGKRKTGGGYIWHFA